MFCITETWLSSTVLDNEILPSNFSLYRKDRESRGGGVLIAVNSLVAFIRHILTRILIRILIRGSTVACKRGAVCNPAA